jgi:hypothetical protein
MRSHAAAALVNGNVIRRHGSVLRQRLTWLLFGYKEPAWQAFCIYCYTGILMPNNAPETSATTSSSARYAVICSLLTTLVVAGGFLWFMAANPNRKGTVTIGSGENPAVKIDIQDGDKIEDVLIRTLNSSSDLEKVALISQISSIIKTHEDLGRKILQSAESGESPFWWDYRTVKVQEDKSLRPESLATCEDSDLRGKKIQLVISRQAKGVNPNKQQSEEVVATDMLSALEVFPCNGREEIIRTNYPVFLKEIKTPGYTAKARKRILLPNGRAPDQSVAQAPMARALTWLRQLL